MRFTQYACALLLAGLLSAAVSPAAFSVPRKAGDENWMKINISGSVIATGSCTFKDSSPQVIEFGDIRYSSVSGVNNLSGSYKQPISSEMTCSGDTAGNTRFRLESRHGTPVSDGSHQLLPVYIGTGRTPNLGIRLLVNGKPQDVNTDFAMDIQHLPVLEAELIQLHPDDNTWMNGQSIYSHAALIMSFN
ncbi:fimbrial protein [Morganella morganii]|uniref:fimbrial protein n=1 Tax=Morganella morganii TaxID=582 RepID=UPI002A2C2989|nr:fimbrial protein [Morganella morganii]EKK5571582.1 fimbrial protein [Morganella morganii]